MSIGPCLCGDPYCAFCGGADPSLETLADEIMEALEIRDEAEGRFLLVTLPRLLESFREAREWERSEAERARLQFEAEKAYDAEDERLAAEIDKVLPP